MKNQKSTRMSFRPTLLALAIMASFQAVSEAKGPPPAGDISQNVTNIAPVFNTSAVPVVISATGASSTFNPLSLETGSTVSVSATGAAASVSVSAINAALMYPDSGLGNIAQVVSNSSTSTPPAGTPVGVNNYYAPTGLPPIGPLVIELGATPIGSSSAAGGLVGIGASVSIAATGAVAAVSVSGISTQTVSLGDPNTAAFTLPGIASVSQVAFVGNRVFPGALNTADVTNDGMIHNVGNMMTGGSASISASGAVGSVGVSVINGDALVAGGLPSSGTGLINTTFSNIGQIGQLVANTGNITNTGLISVATGATLLDAASSVSISGTGAAAAVNLSLVNSNGLSPTPWTIGPVVQVVGNSGNILNAGTFLAGGTGEDAFVPPNIGRGASVSIGATGAAASFSVSAISDQTGKSNITLPGTIGGTVQGLPSPYDTVGLSTGISQAAGNVGVVTNTGLINGVGNMGAGASASVSATGAVTSIAFNGNKADLNGGTPTNIGGIFQAALNVGGVDLISNTGTIYTGNLGNGASVSVGSTGAVASLNVSAIDSSLAGLNIGSGINVFALLEPYIGPAVAGLPQVVRDLVLPLVDSKISVFQGAVNTDNVSNVGTVTAGNLALGASSAISASGAVTSVGFSAINGTGVGSTVLADNSVQNPVTRVSERAAIEQGSLNLGNVVNAATPITTAGMVVGTLDTGASASISATGAVASASVSLNTSTVGPNSGFVFGEVIQGALNSANITNAQGAPGSYTANVMQVGGLPGTGASASISASGAVASISTSTTNSLTGPNTGPQFGAIYQVAVNTPESTGTIGSTTSEITNVGKITIGGTATGVNSSASVGATGAATSFASSNIADPVIFTGSVTGPITQYTSNGGTVTNVGNIAFTGGATTLGVGSSTSVSATGAVASVSYRAVNVASVR